MFIECKAFCRFHSLYIAILLHMCTSHTTNFNAIHWKLFLLVIGKRLVWLFPSEMRFVSAIFAANDHIKMGLVWQTDKILTAARMWLLNERYVQNMKYQQIKMFDKAKEKCGDRMQQSFPFFLFVCFFAHIFHFKRTRWITAHPLSRKALRCFVHFVFSEVSRLHRPRNEPIAWIKTVINWISKAKLFRTTYFIHFSNGFVYLPHKFPRSFKFAWACVSFCSAFFPDKNTITPIYRLPYHSIHKWWWLLLLLLFSFKWKRFLWLGFWNEWELNSRTEKCSHYMCVCVECRSCSQSGSIQWNG